MDNNASNFFTSTLNLRAVAEFVAGFSFFIPLSREVDAYSESDVVDNYGKRMEFSFWVPIWSYDSFDLRKINNNNNNGGAKERKGWNYKLGLNLIL
jgi:hypothetical protein